MVHVVLLDGPSGGSGGTTRAHTVDERLTAFRGMAPEGATVELVSWEDDRDAMLAALRPADVVVALFAYSPAHEEGYFGECIRPLVPELPNLKLINILSSGFDEYLSSADVIWLEEQGITVSNNGGANAVGVSETAVAMMYTVSRAYIANVANTKAVRHPGPRAFTRPPPATPPHRHGVLTPRRLAGGLALLERGQGVPQQPRGRRSSRDRRLHGRHRRVPLPPLSSTPVGSDADPCWGAALATLGGR